MLNEKDKNIALKILGLTVGVFILAFFLIDGGEKTLDDIVKDINPITVKHNGVPVEIDPPDLTKILPEISSYPPQVNSITPSYIEIFSSTEKAGSGTDGWLTEVARDFNDAKIKINGTQVSVKLRGIPSGEGADYITSGKYLPDIYTPSNELWGEMIISRGAKAELVQERLVGNVGGILISKSKREELEEKYGEVNITTVIDAVTNDELQMGYTNPFASSTGLNFLTSILQSFDGENPLSAEAEAGFKGFQKNIRVVAYTTLQLREMVKSGALDAFILEYQTYINEPEIRSYEFIPFGVRHDNPVYEIGELSAEKRRILNEFIKFSQQEKYQTLATKYGFNSFNEYNPSSRPLKGDVIIQAQNLWKIIKDSAPICAVFVADVSGSMDGEPLNNLKRSLIESQKYIGSNNLIGLISYSDDVHIDLPISRFDLKNRSLFAGAVYDFRAGGNTATFDGIAVAMKMLEEQRALNPQLELRIFVLSDGETNRGHSLKDIRGLVEESGIPIYTIGYNANIEALNEISLINEAASINADTEDVVYKLANFFNAML
ncbi:MAG TPA: VWA domain-containing protein [Methanothrix sp.]|jgi:Ca-activated chloride channel family protein|uniref:VWA domain-containing protein n=1 Tax=Methanothrix sp. TaxID=90426 RepID=UPI002B642DD5|nr:VWA domain-containing protein [Methanothrix sp.]